VKFLIVHHLDAEFAEKRDFTTKVTQFRRRDIRTLSVLSVSAVRRLLSYRGRPGSWLALTDWMPAEHDLALFANPIDGQTLKLPEIATKTLLL